VGVRLFVDEVMRYTVESFAGGAPEVLGVVVAPLGRDRVAGLALPLAPAVRLVVLGAVRAHIVLRCRRREVLGACRLALCVLR